MYCQLRMKFNPGCACLDIHKTMRIISSVTATVTWTGHGHGQWQGQDMGWARCGWAFCFPGIVPLALQFNAALYTLNIYIYIYFQYILLWFFLFYCLSYGVLKTWLFRTGRHEDKEEIEWVMGLAQTQDMDKDMDRTVGGVGWVDLGWGGRVGWGEQVRLGLPLSLHYSVCMIM